MSERPSITNGRNGKVVLIGAHRAGYRLNTKYLESQNETQILATFDKLLDKFAAEKNPSETFGDFVHRVKII
jgi:sulfite reductase (NADPH) hemoprotein beta-component